MNSKERAYYLDWIRIGVILLLVPFHCGVTFATDGPGFIKHQQPMPFVALGMWFLWTWFMPILFVVSGIASYHALQRRTVGQYVWERCTKLLLPFIAGMLLVCAPMAYLRALFIDSFHGNLLQFYPRFFTNGAYPAGDLNWGHLWFIIYLFVFTLLLLPLFILLLQERVRARLAAASAILEKGLWLYVAVIPLMLSEILLRPHFPGFPNLFWDWANFTLYLQLVLYGFLFAMNDRILDNIQRTRRVSLGLGVALFAISASPYGATVSRALGHFAPACHVLLIFAWVLAVLGYAKQFLNRPGRCYHYLNRASFPFYIFHWLPITVLAYFIARSDMDVRLKFSLIVAAAYVATFALCEVVQRIPVLRFAFGMKAPQANTP